MIGLTLSEARVDLIRQRVIWPDDEVGLTTTERRLLEYLARRQGQIISREDLLSEVWEYAPSSNTHTVRTTVNRLRAKIEANPSKPAHLLTIRGKGYRLDCEVSPEDAPPEADAPKTTNLAVLPGVFVGRADEISLLGLSLSKPGALVTILGAGGMGKTTLARRFASSQVGGYSGGVWFCDLSEAASRQAAAEAVALALGVTRVQEDASQQVADTLRRRGPTLVVLDNLEQVVEEAAPAVQAWRQAAPEARWLVTSRHRLGVAGEQVVNLGVLSAEEARTFYVERARERTPGWALSREREAALEKVIDRLEGIPLAIDLAAARAAVLPPEALSARLDQIESILRSRQRDRPERHRTLDATLELSWSLLNPPEQAVLAQTSVFRSGFRLDAAEAVLEPPAGGLWVADVLEDLLDKSCLQRVETASGVRFQCLEMVRRFAGTKLSARWGARQIAELRHRHARHYGRLFEADIRSVQAERENVLSGLQAAIQHRWAGAAFELAWGFCRHSMAIGPMSEGLRWMRRARALDGHPPESVARMVVMEGFLHKKMGQMDAAQARYDDALQQYRDLGNRKQEGIALGRLGDLSVQMGKLEHACQLYGEALAVFHDIGDQHSVAVATVNLGLLYQKSGQADLALKHYSDGLAFHRAAGDRKNQGIVLGNMGTIHHMENRLDEAQRCYEEARAIHQEIGNRSARGQLLTNVGNLHARHGRTEAARACYEEALAIHREIGSRRSEGIALGSLAELCLSNGQTEQAGRLFEAALKIHVEVGNPIEGHTRGRIARILASQGAIDDASAMLAAAAEIMQGVDDELIRSMFLTDQAEVRWRSGDPEGAAASLQQAREITADTWVEVLTDIQRVQAMLDNPAS